jgi:predicted GNAT family acetyltransferase
VVREVKAPELGHGRLRRALEKDIDLVAGWVFDFNTTIHGHADAQAARRSASSQIEQGRAHLWDDRGPVSLAVKTRPTRSGISIGMVYTPPQLRGRGYASACVGELSRQLLKGGWQLCSLFVDVENAAANRVYHKVGYTPVCEYREYRFD